MNAPHVSLAVAPLYEWDGKMISFADPGDGGSDRLPACLAIPM